MRFTTARVELVSPRVIHILYERLEFVMQGIVNSSLN